MTEPAALDDHLHWYKDAVIYELHIKAFFDSNNDGIGDFRGLLQKLDYLEDLGVTAIWLLPFYPSPLRDDGYDIADYYSINPQYGNIKHFKRFLKEAHRRNLKVITELVINHTSDQHPLFQRSRRAPKGSPEREFYVWTDNPDQYKDVRIIFQDYEASNWTWDAVAQQYYWHRFFSHQPDLNFDNPLVQDEVFKLIDYWCDMGVDGFRLDAVPYLFERENTNCENLPETHVFLKKLRAHVDEKYPGVMLLAEANMWPEDSASYFGKGDECHMNYHFPIMPRMFMALKMEDRYPIIDIIDQTPAIPETCQWAIFLRNHDELTLEMVTDEERDYMYKVYTKDPQARINLGIRHRLAPLLDNNRKKIELMNYLLFSLPGTPVIYYGDEIGMGDNFYLGDRDGVRTPMQWSPDRNAGFSQANPQKLYLPTIIDPEYSYESVNVETQSHNTSSMLWWMKRVINMRKRYKAFSRGDIKFLNVENPKILAFTRCYEEETILVVVNLSRFAQAASLYIPEFQDYVPTEVFSQNKFPRITDDPYLITLGPNGYFWFSLKPIQPVADTEEGPALKLGSREQLYSAKGVAALEKKVIPAYLPRCRWFGAKARTIQKVKILQRTLMKGSAGGQFLWLICEVDYTEGLPEIYQLPVSFVEEKLANELRAEFPQAIIAAASLDQEEGVIYDAIYSADFRALLFDLIARKKKVRENGDEVRGVASKSANGLLREHRDEVSSRVLKVEQSNSSVIYNDTFFLKLYRKLDRALNPDVEITRYLTEVASFKYVPAFVGVLESHNDSGDPMTLGMMQELVPNQGDAWAYMNDVVQRYLETILTQEEQPVPPARGSLVEPVSFEKSPASMQEALSVVSVQRVQLLGQRTAEMHLALAAKPDLADFRPEPFSLHYQRSLYSSLQSLVRGTYQSLQKNLKNLPEAYRAEAEEIMGLKSQIQDVLKMVYREKFESVKIRTHGDYHLGQVLFTGKDFVILDFEGEPARAYSERRLKRSPLRDVAGMVRSFHYAAYSGQFRQQGLSPEALLELEQWAERWYHYMAGYYMDAYLETARGSVFIPERADHLEIILQTFVLEKAIYELNYELNNRPDWVLIPIRGIKYIMGKYTGVVA